MEIICPSTFFASCQERRILYLHTSTFFVLTKGSTILHPQLRKLVLTELLFDRSVSYIELSEAYIKSLEKSREEQASHIHRLGIRLGAAWDYLPNEKRFTKAAAAYALLKSQVFHTAQIEKDYEAYLKENVYDEDENSTPKTALRDGSRYKKVNTPVNTDQEGDK